MIALVLLSILFIDNPQDVKPKVSIDTIKLDGVGLDDKKTESDYNKEIPRIINRGDNGELKTINLIIKKCEEYEYKALVNKMIDKYGDSPGLWKSSGLFNKRSTWSNGRTYFWIDWDEIKGNLVIHLENLDIKDPIPEKTKQILELIK